MKVEKKGIDQKNAMDLGRSLAQKISYLNKLRIALKNHDDLLVYKLLNPRAYHKVIDHRKALSSHATNSNPARLVLDLMARLSHYLSYHLIYYLGHEYPFFYYDEYQLGKFNIYFGNWWDHQLFGKLDVIHVRFRFDSTKWDKLKRSFQLKSNHRQVNSAEIQRLTKTSRRERQLIDTQSQRANKKIRLKEALRINDSKNKLPWTSGRIKTRRHRILKQLKQVESNDEQATHAGDRIKGNRHRILSLSKEDTILSYEKQSVQRVFGNFTQFVHRNHQLYHDYILKLARKARVKDNHEQEE